MILLFNSGRIGIRAVIVYLYDRCKVDDSIRYLVDCLVGTEVKVGICNVRNAGPVLVKDAVI